MPDTIWWAKWDPRKGGHHFLQKHFVLFNVSFINIETDFVNSFPRLRFFLTPVWMLVRFFDNRSSVGRRDPGNCFFGRRDSGKYFRPAGGIRKIIFGRNFRSRAQIKVQVMTINSVQESSKSDLSSGIFGLFKVGQKSIQKYGFLSDGRSIFSVSK